MYAFTYMHLCMCMYVFTYENIYLYINSCLVTMHVSMGVLYVDTYSLMQMFKCRYICMYMYVYMCANPDLTIVYPICSLLSH